MFLHGLAFPAAKHQGMVACSPLSASDRSPYVRIHNPSRKTSKPQMFRENSVSAERVPGASPQDASDFYFPRPRLHTSVEVLAGSRGCIRVKKIGDTTSRTGRSNHCTAAVAALPAHLIAKHSSRERASRSALGFAAAWYAWKQCQCEQQEICCSHIHLSPAYPPPPTLAPQQGTNVNVASPRDGSLLLLQQAPILDRWCHAALLWEQNTEDLINFLSACTR